MTNAKLNFKFTKTLALVSGLLILGTASQASAAAVVALNCDAVTECVAKLDPYTKEGACNCMDGIKAGCDYVYTESGGCERNGPIHWWNCPEAIPHNYPGDTGVPGERKGWSAKGCFPVAVGLSKESLLNEISPAGN